MHGGAEGSGAPIGNHNALKHGRYTAYAREQRKEARRVILAFRLMARGCPPSLVSLVLREKRRKRKKKVRNAKITTPA